MIEKFVFFGTPELARETLDVLEAHGFIPSAIVTAPDKPTGRHFTLTPTPVKVWAQTHHIPLLTPTMLDEKVHADIQAIGASFGIVVAYGKILPESLLQLFPKGLLNIHYSLLPKYRGASPVESAILHNESETGVTIQKIHAKMDYGPIVAHTITAISANETGPELRRRLTGLGATLLVTTVPKWIQNEIQPIEQNHEVATFCKKIKKEDGEIKLDDDPQINWNKYRAYFGWPGTFFFDERGKRVKITKATLKDGKFVIEKVIPEGKKEVLYEDFVRVSTNLGSPSLK